MRANHLLESRMRENRPSGLEGGARLNPLSLPYRQAGMPDAAVGGVNASQRTLASARNWVILRHLTGRDARKIQVWLPQGRSNNSARLGAVRGSFRRAGKPGSTSGRDA